LFTPEEKIRFFTPGVNKKKFVFFTPWVGGKKKFVLFTPEVNKKISF